MSVFPRRLFQALRCPNDGLALQVQESSGSERGAISGMLRCDHCGNKFPFSHGIVRLLSEVESRHEHSALERRVRDEKAETVLAYDPGHPDDGLGEIRSTLSRLPEVSGRFVLELGAGTGRFTRRLAAAGATVLAVDFSERSLVRNAASLPVDAQVGFVHGDIGRLHVAPAFFDSALSTLYSNLPTDELRHVSSKLVSYALKEGGSYVMTAHHHGIREQLKRAPAESRYANGIYFKSYTVRELTRELSTHFGSVKTQLICIRLPCLSWPRFLRPFVSRMAEPFPLLNKFAELVIARSAKL